MDRVEPARGTLVGNWVLFARLLRDEGVPIGAGEVVALTRALERVDLARPDHCRHAARAVLVGRHAEIEPFERLFDRFWRTGATRRLEPHGRVVSRRPRQRPVLAGLAPPGPADRERARPETERDPALAVYSARELLREKDFARLTPDEAAEVRRLMDRLRFRLAQRRTRRMALESRGAQIDLRRTLRHALRFGGEPLRLARRERRLKERPLVLLCDVSGSMALYSRLLLRFLYAAGRSTRTTEAFLFGTRLTRVTRQLRDRQIDRALTESARRATDWGGGTRIGETLKRFNYRWARRVLARGAVVVLISDGWDTGDVELLRRELARLKRNTHRLLWLNPLLGSPDYEPLTRGMRAALPLVDDFLPVHNLASLEQLAELLGTLDGRPAGAGRR